MKAVVAYPEGDGAEYRGEVSIPFEIQIPSGESGAEFEVRVSFQPCTESECLLPQERTLSGVALR